MLKKIMAIGICFALFSGFNWGSDQEETASQTPPARPATTAARMNPESIKAVTKLLGTGTPEEKKQRMQGIQRVAESLRNKRANTTM